MVMSFHQVTKPGSHQEGADRADERPRARFKDVVVVVLGVGLGHFVSSPCLEGDLALGRFRPACHVSYCAMGLVDDVALRHRLAPFEGK